MTTYGFPFTVALTTLHTLFTLGGMAACRRWGVFEPKRLPRAAVAPLAAAYVAYIVLCNLSLRLNSVSFYQARRRARRLLSFPARAAAPGAPGGAVLTTPPHRPLRRRRRRRRAAAANDGR